MQHNYNTRLSSRQSIIKKKIRNFFFYILVLLLILFLLDKFNFPSPKQDIKKNINNEIIKLK